MKHFFIHIVCNYSTPTDILHPYEHDYFMFLITIDFIEHS